LVLRPRKSDLLPLIPNVMHASFCSGSIDFFEYFPMKMRYNSFIVVFDISLVAKFL
jgi:hypothetical protein